MAILYFMARFLYLVPGFGSDLAGAGITASLVSISHLKSYIRSTMPASRAGDRPSSVSCLRMKL